MISGHQVVAHTHLGGTTTEIAPLTLILNILWLVFGGLAMALAWLIASALMALTIVFIPWSPAAFFGTLAFWLVLGVTFTNWALKRARREGKLVKMK